MDTLRLKNYRCFDDTGDIDIKPITFLLGSNSSGKSSFLKFFPLLKQSIGLRRNGTFLWLANDVDFKDYNNTVKDGKGNISFTFSFKNFLIKNFASFEEEKIDVPTELRVEITIAPDGDRYDYVKEFSFHFCDHSIVVKCKKNATANVFVNGEQMPEEYRGTHTIKGTNLLPNILFREPSEQNRSVWSEKNGWAHEQIYNIIGKNKELIRNYRYNELRTPFLTSRAILKDVIKERFRRVPISQLDKIVNFYYFCHINNIIDGVNDGISSLCMGMSYIKPLRATTERYYRYQNYAMDEIDSDGKNLAMYLANLSETALSSFNDWLFDIFKFRLDVKPIEGHVVINIEEDGKPKRNIVDVGFGYTQILPVLAIIWKALEMDRRARYHNWTFESDTHLVIIEQPELHLHPKMQGLFAKMLADVIISAKKRKKDLRFVIETHSDVMINKIGELLNDDENGVGINSDDTEIVLFNVKESGKRYVETTSFRSDGSLEYWPIGFLSDYAH